MTNLYSRDIIYTGVKSTEQASPNSNEACLIWFRGLLSWKTARKKLGIWKYVFYILAGFLLDIKHHLK